MSTELTFPIETFELSNNCTCEFYDEDTDTFAPANYCYGDCYTEQRAFVVDMLNEWATAIGLDAYDGARLAIHGSGMGWIRSSGTALADSVEGIVELLRLDRAEYRLVFKRDGNALTATRYSHDEPTGASFRILLAL